jgi:hypothetical protein
VRVEGRGRDGRSATLLEEARIRLLPRKFVTVQVEDLDDVRRSSAVSMLVKQRRER